MTPNIAPPVAITDGQKVLLFITPRDKDDKIIANLSPIWESSDPSVELEPQPEFEYDDSVNGNGKVTLPAGYRCYAKTPGKEGGATVRVKAEGMRDSVIHVSYIQGVPDNLNLSAGDPEID